MLCEKCSAQGAENTSFCSVCGVSLTAAEPTPKKKLNYRILGAIACAAIALAAVIALFFLLVGVGNPQTVLEKFVKAATDADLKIACKYSVFGDAERFTRTMMRAEGITAREFDEMLREQGFKDLDDAFRAFAEEEQEWLRDCYGADYQITVHISDERILSQRELRECIRELKEDYDYYYDARLSDFFNADRITEIREYSVEIRIVGSEGYDTDYETYYVAKLGRKWLVFIDISDLF